MRDRFRLSLSALALAAVLGMTLTAGVATAVSTADDEADIRAVIGTAYIDGLHLNGSRAAIRAGFHPDFVMSVHTEDGVRRVGIEDWIGNLPAEGQAPNREVTYEIPNVTITGDAAVATVEVSFDGSHVYTDYMGLYRFPEGWRIVNKIFYSH